MGWTKELNEGDWYLLHTLVHVARADDEVVPMEVAFIDTVMKALDVGDADRRTVKAMLRGEGAIPPVDARPPASLTYERKLDVFREAISLAFADGVFAHEEKALVNKLVQRLGLHPGDMQPIWDRAKRHYLDG
ncbi:MAG: TerB family tellurite resistance protein [Deltaproteobacteria bacterium]|nr:TerB family tellurite resistance protein [Deltaproteobacteria bacterium]